MVKGNYLIADHMWWCSLVVGEGMREAEVVGSNPSNAKKNRTRAYSRKKSRDLRWEKENILLIFISAANIYFSTQKNDARRTKNTAHTSTRHLLCI